MKHIPFKVVNKNGQPKVEVDVKGYVVPYHRVATTNNLTERPSPSPPKKSAPWFSRR